MGIEPDEWATFIPACTARAHEARPHRSMKATASGSGPGPFQSGDSSENRYTAYAAQSCERANKQIRRP